MSNDTEQQGSIERIDDLIGAKLVNIFTKYSWGKVANTLIGPHKQNIHFIYEKDEKEFCLEYSYDKPYQDFEIIDEIGELSNIINEIIIDALIIKSKQYEIVIAVGWENGYRDLEQITWVIKTNNNYYVLMAIGNKYMSDK